MNDTIFESNSNLQDNYNNLHGYDYSTYILGTLLFISEILPMIKSKSNGISHTILCLIQGSKCMLESIEGQVAKNVATQTTSSNPV